MIGKPGRSPPTRAAAASFNSLTAESADPQKFGFPPRQEDASCKAKYERFLNRMKDKLHYVPGDALRQQRDIPRGRVSGWSSAGTETSTNWSGEVVYAPPRRPSFTWILATAVPDIDAPADNQWYYCASWIGLDGDGSGDVCQAGIGSQVYASGSTVTKYFYPWFEWYPGPEIQITNFPVSPGDMIEVLLCAQPGAGATSATVSISWPNISSRSPHLGRLRRPGHLPSKLVGNRQAERVVESAHGRRPAKRDRGLRGSLLLRLRGLHALRPPALRGHRRQHQHVRNGAYGRWSSTGTRSPPPPSRVPSDGRNPDGGLQATAPGPHGSGAVPCDADPADRGARPAAGTAAGSRLRLWLSGRL